MDQPEDGLACYITANVIYDTPLFYDFQYIPYYFGILRCMNIRCDDGHSIEKIPGFVLIKSVVETGNVELGQPAADHWNYRATLRRLCFHRPQAHGYQSDHADLDGNSSAGGVVIHSGSLLFCNPLRIQGETL